ncbi:MAG: FmdB family zinc ribbon protein [Actinomycetota bacterium]
MPVFDFKCAECHERSEFIVLTGEEPPTTCPSCGGPLKRAYSGGRVRINLEGWGFSRNDALISDTKAPRKNWKEMKERANQIRDEG